MKLLAVSDWRVQDINLLYGTLDNRDDIDAIVYAGDDLDRFHDGDTNHLAELGAATTTGNVFAVCGNDDFPGTAAPLFEASNVHDVHNEPYVIDDTAFIGQEGSLENTPGHILYSEDEIETHLAQQFEAAADAAQVCLITHTPPFGTLDYAKRFGQRPIGSHAVADAITTYSPTVVVCVAVKQGRKYKLGLCLITQNPDDLDDDIIKQINTNIFLGLKSEVVGDVSSIPAEFAKDLPNFGKGQSIVKAPDVEAVEVKGLQYCLTRHGN